ncbi:MAG TPA: diguanylate cyclase [Candidatus Binatia bacterium]|nr:diguanylate cyclase [Candidatus Binatia bacterium]
MTFSAAITLLVFLGALYLFRRSRSARQQTIARESESRFRALAEAIPEIVWTAIPQLGLDYCNQRLCDLTGRTLDQLLGWKWTGTLHPDDVPLASSNWEKGRQTGSSIEAEYRFRTAKGDYRWHLVRATPMRDSSGQIVRWFGCCVDIDDQMRHQQVLEEEVKQHTAALFEANLRLETEMRERALAQQELNQQNERMVSELTQRSTRATSLAKMAELLQSCSDLKDIFAVVGGMAPKIFPELRGAVLMLNSSHDQLDVAASWSDCCLPATTFVPGDCWALRLGHAHIVATGDSTAVCRHLVAGQEAYACLPLISQGGAIGVVHFQTIGAGTLSEAVILMANMFAEQVGLSVANLRLREALRDQSIRDPLTGLYNRRYLEETLEREIRRAVRSENLLGVLMLDLDHFKKFNDTYGHDAGDTVLRETAAFLGRSVRAEDIVCRFGGEEFVIILPLADIQTTQARAERIRSKLRELAILHQGKAVGLVTVSVGVAELPQHGTTPKTLLEAADAALYVAKREGRDRVVVAEERSDANEHPVPVMQKS